MICDLRMHDNMIHIDTYTYVHNVYSKCKYRFMNLDIYMYIYACTQRSN